MIAHEHFLRKEQQKSLFWKLTQSLSTVMLLPLSIFIEKVAINDNPQSLECTDGGLQNVLSLLSSQLGHQFQHVLESSLASLYTVALFCHHTLQESRPVSCSFVVACWQFSQGAYDGASQRLYQLLLSPEKYCQLGNFLSKFTTESRDNGNRFEFILLVLTRMLLQIGLSDIQLYNHRDFFMTKLDTPLGETKLRVMVEQEMVFDANSGTMVVASLKPMVSGDGSGKSIHTKAHLDLGFLRQVNCTPRHLLLALSYAAILVHQNHIACCIAYLLGRMDIFQYIYESHVRTEVETLAIIEFCFNVESINPSLHHPSDRPSSRIIQSIESELMNHVEHMTCVEAVAVICRHLDTTTAVNK